MRDVSIFDQTSSSATDTTHETPPLLDWNNLLVKVLPRRLWLGALILAIGTGVDLPWLNEHPVEIIAIRIVLIAGVFLTGWLSRYCSNQIVAEAIVVMSSLSGLTGMAILGWLEGTYLAYTAAIYQILIFVVVFLPLPTPVYAGLLASAGALWFGVFPVVLPLSLDLRLLFSNAVGYLTYGIMLLVGNRLFLRLRAEEVAKRTDLETQARLLQEMSIRDGLTGLYNFRHLQEAFPRLVTEAARFDQPLSLCLLDLDNFKTINDVAGHTAGNAVLHQVARCLANNVRPSDYLFRVGGDEFAIAFPNTSANDAHAVALRIQNALATLQIESTWISLQRLPAIRCSIGIAEMLGGGGTHDDLSKAADRALYQAKAAKGRESGQVVVA